MKKITQPIKDALKENGYNAKTVSVKDEKVMYDHHILITIRKSGIPAKEIEEIVKPFRIIHRDFNNGILKCGNVFIDIVYADDYIGKTVESKREEAESLWKKSNPDDNNSFYIRAGVRLCNNGKFVFLKKDGSINGSMLACADELAEWLARHDYENKRR